MSAVEQFRATLAEVQEEYVDVSHRRPWIVAFSGGKDSTLLLQAVVEAMLNLAPSERTREVHVLANDTLVESPLVSAHLDRCLNRIADGVRALRLPVKVVKTTPRIDQTFWVNLIGRGYPSPNRMFRWCTDRLKIQPTSDYIKEQVSAAGEVVLLIGVRRAESAARAATVAKYTSELGGRLNPHNDLRGCWVYRPIVEFSTNDVWDLLLQRPPPWGGSHRDLVTLYKHAQGGECPLVIDKSQAAGCGTSSSRFGCWTCTVVEKDRSLTNTIDSLERSAEFEQADKFTHLLKLRDWLAEIRSEPAHREKLRRGGSVRFKKDGEPIPGPFTLETRREILARLLQVQAETQLPLITDRERHEISKIWREDQLAQLSR